MEDRPRVLELSLDRPDPDAMGGVALHVAALALHAPHDVPFYSAHPDGEDLIVEQWSPRRLVAALPMTGPLDDTTGRPALAQRSCTSIHPASARMPLPGRSARPVWG
jgi:hypothetical protein